MTRRNPPPLGSSSRWPRRLRLLAWVAAPACGAGSDLLPSGDSSGGTGGTTGTTACCLSAETRCIEAGGGWVAADANDRLSEAVCRIPGTGSTGSAPSSCPASADSLDCCVDARTECSDLGGTWSATGSIDPDYMGGCSNPDNGGTTGAWDRVCAIPPTSATMTAAAAAGSSGGIEEGAGTGTTGGGSGASESAAASATGSGH